MPSKSDTHITPELQTIFEGLRDPRYTNFALFSCFVNGDPAVASVAINTENSTKVTITPLFVSVTDAMVLTDHNGEPTARTSGKPFDA